MKVILLENLENLGHIGDIVNVKDGYARNYLLPKKIAAIADPKKIKQLEHDKQRAAKKLARLKKAAEVLADKMKGLKFTYERKVSDDGKLFGSVSAVDIVKSLKEEGFDIRKGQIELKSPLKQLGIFQVKVKLEKDVEVGVEVEIVAEEKTEEVKEKEEEQETE